MERCSRALYIWMIRKILSGVYYSIMHILLKKKSQLKSDMYNPVDVRISVTKTSLGSSCVRHIISLKKNGNSIFYQINQIWSLPCL